MKRYVYVDKTTHEYKVTNERPEMKLCDFCCAEEIHQLYPTRTYVADEGQISTDGFTACRLCSLLVDSEQWDELVKRSVDAFMGFHPEIPKGWRSEVEREIKHVHDDFRLNRISPQ